MTNGTDKRGRIVRRERRWSPGFTLSRFVYSLASIAIVILAFRFVLRLFAANPDATFVQFVYSISQPLVAPFETVFPTAAFDQAVLEWNSLLAMAVYGVLAWGLDMLLGTLGSSRSSTEVVERFREEDS